MKELSEYLRTPIPITDSNNAEQYIKAIKKLYDIREFYEGGSKILAGQFVRADLDHSSLLRRILNNKKIYKYIPPRAMSYPWYELLDNRILENCYGYPVTNIFNQDIEPTFILEQSAWKIIKEIDAETWTIQYMYSHDELSPWIAQLEFASDPGWTNSSEKKYNIALLNPDSDLE